MFKTDGPKRVLLLIATLAACGAAAGPARAATVAFDPPAAEVVQGQTAEFRVQIASSQLDPFDSIDLLLGSDLPGLGFSFEYDPSFTTSLTPPEPSSPGIFASDIFVGGVNFDGWSPPVVIGTLRVETTALTPGTYSDAVAVRPDAEAEMAGSSLSMIGQGATVEPELLSGAADLVVNEAPDSDGGDSPGTGTSFCGAGAMGAVLVGLISLVGLRFIQPTRRGWAALKQSRGIAQTTTRKGESPCSRAPARRKRPPTLPGRPAAPQSRDARGATHPKS